MTTSALPPNLIVPIILSGGMGTRLWPLSRGKFPKQFLHLNNHELGLFQETLNRVSNRTLFTAPIIICNKQHRFLVADQLQQLGIEDAIILLEPTARNTAPAIASACAYIEETLGTRAALVLPSDHIIINESAFLNAVKHGYAIADAGKIVTFGITPTSAETGFGYIKASHPINNHAYIVDSFIEKPDATTAQHYVDSGNYSWNSGIFLFSTAQLLTELATHAPNIRQHSTAATANRTEDADFIRLNEEAFSLNPSQSIDYALMEHSTNIAVIPINCGWSDAGSWQSLWNEKPKDKNNNVIQGENFTIDTTNCYIASTENTHIATLGVQNLVIISTKDAILVADKSRAQEVKHIVDLIKQTAPNLIENHRTVYRPWGKFESLDTGKRHQVKRLTIKAGAAISEQLHHHRCEHWVVVSGTAHISRDGKDITVQENESIFIPAGTKHRIQNKGDRNLEIIEVQSGLYLAEDDIIRFEDNYGRTDFEE